MKTLSISEIRRLETQAVSSGIPEYTLMVNAGKAAAEIINRECANFSRAVILCGSGNNGGDALVTAACLNMPVVIYSVCDKERFKGCAKKALLDLPENIPFYHREYLTPNDFQIGDVIVDGLLGIGFTASSMRKNYANYIECANNSNAPIYSLDLPSGLDGDTGSGNEIINAHCTIVFGALKRGLFSPIGSQYRGKLHYVDINLGFGNSTNEDFEVYTRNDAVKHLPKTAVFSHKNSRGRVLVVAGSKQYPGAAALASITALRTGAGIVRLATVSGVTTQLPYALICRYLPAKHSGVLAVDTWSHLQDYIDNSDVLVFGPGLGMVDRELLIGAINFHGPTLFDADGLNLIARHADLWENKENRVITPHLGEAKKLAQAFEISYTENRVDLALALASKMGVTTVLKGRDTVVATTNGDYSINSSGNSNLATAGSGDVLSGFIGALLTKLSPYEAARLGVFLHGVAGENTPGLIADDLMQLCATALSNSRR